LCASARTRRGATAALLIDEARLLAAVAAFHRCPSRPTFTPQSKVTGYFKLPAAVADMSRRERSDHGPSIAGTLGELLTAMHAGRLTGGPIVDTDDRPLAEWRREAAETY